MCLGLVFASHFASTAEAAEYRLSADVGSQLATVTVRVEEPARAFAMPAWAPGDYEIFNYGQYVKSIEFRRAGKAVAAKQDGMNRWTIDEGADEAVYTVAPSRGNFTPNLRINENEWFVSGPGVLGGFEGHVREKQTLILDAPPDWVVGVALPARTEGAIQQNRQPRVFEAPDYDTLLDSPFVIGDTVRFHTFEVAGVQHRIVGYNQSAGVDLASFASVGAKIAGEAHKLFGEFGYERYDFMLDFGGPGGGLEHLNCTRIGLSARATGLSAAGIMAHEYFHNYNVKRIRAKALGPFDYSKPGMTGTLWWLEGVTDYYADVLLTRAGLKGLGDFRRGEASSILGVSGGKYLQVSADEASRRVWEGRGSYGWGGVNYYARGHAAGAVLDLAIRAHSGGKHSLDDVIRKLWAENKGGKPGYADERLRELCVEFGGNALGSIYDACVMKPGRLPIDQALAPWGGSLGEGGFEVPPGNGFERWPLAIG